MLVSPHPAQSPSAHQPLPIFCAGLRGELASRHSPGPQLKSGLTETEITLRESSWELGGPPGRLPLSPGGLWLALAVLLLHHQEVKGLGQAVIGPRTDCKVDRRVSGTSALQNSAFTTFYLFILIFLGKSLNCERRLFISSQHDRVAQATALYMLPVLYVNF